MSAPCWRQPPTADETANRREGARWKEGEGGREHAWRATCFPLCLFSFPLRPCGKQARQLAHFYVCSALREPAPLERAASRLLRREKREERFRRRVVPFSLIVPLSSPLLFHRWDVAPSVPCTPSEQSLVPLLPSLSLSFSVSLHRPRPRPCRRLARLVFPPSPPPPPPTPCQRFPRPRRLSAARR